MPDLRRTEGWKPDRGDIYYRPILAYEGKSRFYTPACLQWFDEFGYREDQFLNDVRYEDESDCQKVCDAVFMFVHSTSVPLLGVVPNRSIWEAFAQLRPDLATTETESYVR